MSLKSHHLTSYVSNPTPSISAINFPSFSFPASHHHQPPEKYTSKNGSKFLTYPQFLPSNSAHTRLLLSPASRERNSGNCDSGCAETYESGSQSQSDRRRRFTDRHQKVRQFRQGDLIALPAGLTLWFYNNGNEPLVTVALLDTGNEANQLDQQFRNFFLAGSPRGGTQSPYGQRERGEEQGQRNNIFHGIDEELVAEVFGVDIETARRLRGRDDQRGQIVRAEKFNIVLPGEEEERRERGHWPANGLEETLCTKKLIENIDSPKRADTYNPAAAASAPSTAKSSPFSSGSVLVPRKESYTEYNAILAPHWNVNAHSIIYITRGSGRFQVVGHTGKSVFDGDVREGQMIIVPQNYVVVKRASEDEGLEWISFKTNDNAVTSQLAGRLSAIRAFPLEVVMNSRCSAVSVVDDDDGAELPPSGA
ncbi:hypothetical protein DH2020_027382 [Rehmannia glutinosa]|uniref:Cupin type-1 domain-containing protein n=1 Tax=Rehmannia glutinosa TaxID=99300 RepID=A0ABR0VW68_REHGL